MDMEDKIRKWLKIILLIIFGGTAVVGLGLIVVNMFRGDATGVNALGVVFGSLLGNYLLAAVVFSVFSLGYWLWLKGK